MQLFLINTDDGRTPPMENAYTANAVESGEPLINTGEQQDGIMIVAPEEENPTFVSATKARANREIRVTRVQENQLWEVLLDDGEELPKNFELHQSEVRGTQTFYIGRFVLGATMPEWLNIPDDIEDGAVPTYDATEEKVDWKVQQGGGGEDFVVNIELVWDEIYDRLKVNTADKTFDDIDAAYQAGKKIIVKAIYNDDVEPWTAYCLLNRRQFIIDGDDPTYDITTYNFTWFWVGVNGSLHYENLTLRYWEDHGEEWVYHGAVLVG